jgi:hypothetical protein
VQIFPQLAWRLPLPEQVSSSASANILSEISRWRASVRQEYGKIALILVLVILTIGWMTDPLAAQIISGDLVGTVFDRTGAVVPDATVEATKQDTGAKYRTKVDENGEYRFNNLPVGTYDISASTADFATTTINGFRIDLNKTSTLLITLDVKGGSYHGGSFGSRSSLGYHDGPVAIDI